MRKKHIKKRKNEDMKKNNMGNLVSYTTTVKLEKYKGDELVNTTITHNAGTWRLFNAICIAIARGSTDTLMPQYIDVRKIDTSSDSASDVSSLTTPIPLTDVTYDIIEASSTDSSEIYPSGSCNVYLTFSIYNDNLANYEGNYLVLQDASTSKYKLAYVSLAELGMISSDGGLNLDTDEMLLVTWVITIGNGTTESTSEPNTEEPNGDGNGNDGNNEEP